METSIIIRTKNEEKWIGKVLEMIFDQTYKNFEVIVVDSGSTDQTLEIAQKFPVRIVKIKPEEFSYPYALNVGCREAQGKYLVLLSAHSLPMHKTFLEEGVKNFSDEKVMGSFGSMRALPDAGIAEKIFFNVVIAAYDFFTPNKLVLQKGGTGIMGFTNAIIRKELWEKYNFNEEFGLGGEDEEWSKYWFSRGYVAIRDRNLTVQHSHGLNIIQFLRQWKYWHTLNKPQSYKKQNFRK